MGYGVINDDVIDTICTVFDTHDLNLIIRITMTTQLFTCICHMLGSRST